MKEQTWWCEGCGVSGSVPVRDGAGVMEIINAIIDAHEAHEGAVCCTSGCKLLRVEAERSRAALEGEGEARG